MSGADWTELMNAELRSRWVAGDKAKDIALGLGVSKNAVVAKAHRLNLPSRPSPIRRSAEPKAGTTPPTERAAALKLPDAVKQAAPARPRKAVDPEPRPDAKADAAGAGESPKPPPAGERPQPEGCRWPLWPFAAAPTHKYCGEPRVDVAEPYCAVHRAIACVPIKRLVAA